MKTFKILGLLLSYPEPELIAHLDDCKQVLSEENLLPKKAKQSVFAMIDLLSGQDIYQSQEDYVATFDRGRNHCLHLFEHVYGESRDRGQAMVDLAEMYASRNLFVRQGELPDFLPLFLEYLSLLSFDEAKELLGEPIDVIATIGAKLTQRESIYASVFSALEALSKAKANSAAVKAALENSEEIDSLEALDKQWEEPEAFGGPNAADCGSCNINMKSDKAGQPSGVCSHG
jgi:nitrate reductase delta subunit